MKPATKKEKATEVEVQPLPYTQILRMVQVTFRCGCRRDRGMGVRDFQADNFNFKNTKTDKLFKYGGERVGKMSSKEDPTSPTFHDSSTQPIRKR